MLVTYRQWAHTSGRETHSFPIVSFHLTHLIIEVTHAQGKIMREKPGDDIWQSLCGVQQPEQAGWAEGTALWLGQEPEGHSRGPKSPWTLHPPVHPPVHPLSSWAAHPLSCPSRQDQLIVTQSPRSLQSPGPRSQRAFEAPRAGLAQLGIKYTALAMSDTASDVQQGVHHTGPP